MTDSLRYLGNTVQGAIDADQLDTVDAPASLATVTITTDELTAICPVTKQPDLYRAEITYTPNGRVIESKALKLHLTGYRDTGVMCEHLAARIADDLTAAVATTVTVTLRQQVRGGLVITATAHGKTQHHAS